MSETPTTEPTNDAAGNGSTAEGQPSSTPPATGQAPKWEGDFDPERAARLVENLRKERDEARARAKGDPSELAALKAQVDGLTAELTQSRIDTARASAIEAASVPAHLAAYVTGSTPEALKASAEKVAADFAASQAADSALPGRPKPRLTPGHGPSDASPEFDPVATARAARGY